jgi:hypothetical protein
VNDRTQNDDRDFQPGGSQRRRHIPVVCQTIPGKGGDDNIILTES